MTLPAILFDLDGTLIDTIELILSSARHAFEEWPVRPTDEEWVRGIGTPLVQQLRAYAAKALRERGIDLRLGTSVKEVHADSVVVQRKGEEPETIPAAVVVWATGVTAAPIVADWGLPTGKGSRIETDADLRVKGHPEIFAVGDVAVNPDDPLPQLAQPAIQGGKHAGVQIRRILAGSPTEPFSYHDKGTMATIGRGAAVVQMLGGRTMKGHKAQFAWRTVHLALLPTNEDRAKAVVDWAGSELTHQRVGRISVGPDE